MNLFAALITFVLPQPVKPAVHVAHFVDAIKAVEHSRIDYVSPTGARGVYQLKRAVWEKYSKRPFEWASEFSYVAQEETRHVALQHAHWVVEKAIPALNLPVTPYAAALIWNKGYGNVEKLNLSDKNVDFAHRVENYYEQLVAQPSHE